MYKSSNTFYGKPVKDISEEKNLDLSKISPLVRIEPDEDLIFSQAFEKFLSENDTSKMDSLVIGFWSDDYDLSDTNDMKKMAENIFSHKDELSALKALFVGAIEQEESEISWIETMDLSPFINNGDLSLEYFRARGAGDFFEQPLKSTKLKKLALETGGMDSDTVSHILFSDLPNLEHLELWIGDDAYGNTGIKSVTPLFDSTKFPKLRYLGLRNCEFADDVAVAIANSPIVNQLEELDLSLGAIGDKGALALAASPSIAKLKKLNLDHHYMTDKGLKAIKAAVPHVSTKDQQEEDDWGEGEMHRYIFVSE